MFFKHRKKPQEIKQESLDTHINNICNILKIDAPNIISVAGIYDTEEGIKVFRYQVEDTQSTSKPIGGYYLDKENLIYISRTALDINYQTGETQLVELTMAEMLYFIAHELRHVWQKKYHEDTYYKKNAVQFETIKDIAEIDADAFALSYVFSNQTSFSGKDLPTTLSEILFFCRIDNGERLNKARLLANEYEFDISNKLDETSNYVDEDELNYLCAWAKLGGLI